MEISYCFSSFPLIFPQGEDNFTYCPATGLAKGNEHSEFAGWAFPFPGVFLVEEFISEDEECEIVELMDRDDWKPSQSGRKKQVEAHLILDPSGKGKLFSVKTQNIEMFH